MQAPKRKTSKSKRNMRRSHHALTPGRLHACPNCGAQVKSHHVCASCGQYRGRQLIVGTDA
ncbi:UNVERIFIED_CONTAM: hypothetical protein GTU68_040612 [Idotea baltica]|nr:hypothetical protein [Idotea baltica]